MPPKERIQRSCSATPGAAFNDMASSLRVKQELIDVQQVENEKLMHTLMPESVAKRYKQGEESISEQHDNVAVVYAELVGFDDYARKLSGDQEITQLNRERALSTAIAADLLTVLVVPLATLDTLVSSRPLLASEIGTSIELKRKSASEALATPVSHAD